MNEILWTSTMGGQIAGHDLTLDLRHWVNDGLMTLFFFVVGLEINRELVEGELNDARRAALPCERHWVGCSSLAPCLRC